VPGKKCRLARGIASVLEGSFRGQKRRAESTPTTLERFERSEAIERLERLSLRPNDAFYAYLTLINQAAGSVRPAAPADFVERLNDLKPKRSADRLKTGARQSGNHKVRQGKKGIRKISQQRLCLLTPDC
jgi:hypothetical protein